MGSYRSGRSRTVIPEDTADRVRQLRAEGMSWENVSRTVGITSDILRRNFGYEKPERMVARAAKTGHRRDGVLLEYEKVDPVILSTIPRDTRSFTARAMGDPLPGRSALDNLRQRREAPRGPYSPVKAERTYWLRGFLEPGRGRG